MCSTSDGLFAFLSFGFRFKIGIFLPGFLKFEDFLCVWINQASLRLLQLVNHGPLLCLCSVST